MRRTLEGLQNPDVQIARERNLVDLEYADDIVLMFEEKENEQVLLNELTKVISSFDMYFAPTNCAATAEKPGPLEAGPEFGTLAGPASRRDLIGQQSGPNSQS
ncbi:hypothetical protein T265_01836 [Opisthorchis viverrini]|uniref:Reverse transcriptase domain-containing protein n=1 Tax=Opisthorchis viverrini TaxID=6198 RepID=A0A074ZYA6_OPIVI|nr:hypothetical protein T265_01836 [Opisthorchis viverrini]KER32061.1 hypothetical protein T265_01836 [Opisthorchis viverrini]